MQVHVYIHIMLVNLHRYSFAYMHVYAVKKQVYIHCVLHTAVCDNELWKAMDRIS